MQNEHIDILRIKTDCMKSYWLFHLFMYFFKNDHRYVLASTFSRKKKSYELVYSPKPNLHIDLCANKRINTFSQVNKP